MTPRSFLGRLITLPLLCFGLLLIALPSFVLGREFSLVWEKMTRDQVGGQHPSDIDILFNSISTQSSTLDQSNSPAPSATQHPVYPPEPAMTSPRLQDLSNFKLAQNQTELSEQIDNLKAIVEMQGKMMNRLLDVIEGRKREDVQGRISR